MPPPHSLAVQKVHDGLQDVVSILCNAAASAGRDIAGALHLAQDVTHLLHALLNVRLETGDRNAQAAQHPPQLRPGPAWPSGPPRLASATAPGPPNLSLAHRPPLLSQVYLVAKTRLSSSRTLLSFTCSSLRMSLASVSSWRKNRLEKLSGCLAQPWGVVSLHPKCTPGQGEAHQSSDTVGQRDPIQE